MTAEAMPRIVSMPRPGFANVVSCLALFIALGSGAYAATQLPKNSVGPKQLKRNAVTTLKIRNGAVTGAKIDLKSLGLVPRAAQADTASDAATLGGKTAAQISGDAKPRCPAATIAVAGACLEAAKRSKTSSISAIADCARDGLRLPSVGELAAFNAGLTAENESEWADALFETASAKTGGAFIGRTDKGGLILGVGNGTQQEHPYRCVVPDS
jgi:hypothetical protein